MTVGGEEELVAEAGAGYPLEELRATVAKGFDLPPEWLGSPDTAVKPPEEGFFEEDEDPEAVARLAALFAGPRRFVRDETEMVQVVQTLRRQSERQVREEIASELKEWLELLQKTAREMEDLGWPERERDVMRARLQEFARARWIAMGRPGRGISCVWELEYPLPGHAVKLNGIPVRGPVGYAVNCPCDPDRPWHEDWGWSPTIVGAKRLARRHAGLM